jgi:hypothetical protein
LPYQLEKNRVTPHGRNGFAQEDMALTGFKKAQAVQQALIKLVNFMASQAAGRMGMTTDEGGDGAVESVA